MTTAFLVLIFFLTLPSHKLAFAGEVTAMEANAAVAQMSSLIWVFLGPIELRRLKYSICVGGLAGGSNPRTAPLRYKAMT